MPYKDFIFRNPPNPCKVVVEVGVYQGAWTKRASRYLDPEATIYAIDSWTGIVAGKSTAFAQAIFQQLCAEELQSGRVVEIHLPSVQAAQYWGSYKSLAIDLLHLDGDHYRLYPDLVAWIPFVRHRGVILCHDFSGHRQSKYVQRDIIRYFGTSMAWKSGAYMGATQRQALKIHSAWIEKQGVYGEQDKRSIFYG